MNTPQEMVEVCEAIRDGMDTQYENCAGSWVDSNNNPNFGAFRYRVKPTLKLKRVPLGPEDFPPGTVVRRNEWCITAWRCISEVGSRGITMPGGQYLNFNEMNSGGWLRLLPGTTEWLPCYKEVEA